MPHATPASPATLPGAPWPVLQAPEGWQTIDFISDLHLQPSEPATQQAWLHYLRHTRAQAVFILGDLFEVWVGDDVLEPSGTSQAPADAGFEAGCADALREASTHCALFFVHGNRDFLLGDRFARASGMALLQDPTILAFANQRWLLSHGDALCLDDSAYMAFRAQVRGAAWHEAFLAQPLAQRRDAARALRAQSQARQRAQPVHADLDTDATLHWLEQAGATTLIHGHTHRPANHELPGGRQRVVLSDWDLQAHPPRAQVLRLGRDGTRGVRMERLAPEYA